MNLKKYPLFGGYFLSVEFEGFDWVLAGGLDGWIDAEGDADCEAGEAGEAKDLPGNVWGKWGDEGDEECRDVAEDEAHDAANHTKDEGLEEELE